MNFEILIKNGKIIDGSGNPGFYSDIGIDNEKITLLDFLLYPMH